MNTDATPMNPISWTAAFTSLPKEGNHNLEDIFRDYGTISFRNGFGLGFVVGASIATLIAVALQKA